MGLRARARHAANRVAAWSQGRAQPGRILLYHHIEADASDPNGVPRDLWRQQLDWLSQTGLSVSAVKAAEATAFAQTIGLSFDDGYICATEACSDLLARGWSATIFVVPEWIERGRSHLLGWAELRELARCGIEVGAHGLDHERLCGGDVGRFAEQLIESRERLRERLGREVYGLAYPDGLYDRAAVEAARRAGFRYACTAVPGRNLASSDRFLLRRNEILASDGAVVFAAKLRGSDDWFAPIRRLEILWRCR